MAKVVQNINGVSSGYQPQPTGNMWDTTGTQSWGTVGVSTSSDNNGWFATQNTNVGATSDMFGAVISDTAPSDINVPEIVKIIKQAISLYDTGKHDKKLVATEVDLLRGKLRSKEFDCYNSVELRNIFGYILGDVVSELIEKRGGDYDSILNVIFDNFPAGTGNPVRSQYATSGSKYASMGKYGKIINDVKRYINKNSLKNPNTVGKFLKLWDNFKASKPELDSIDVQDLFKSFTESL